MRRLIIISVLVFCTTTSFAQLRCGTPSIGDFFAKLKSLKPIKSGLLSYKKYDSFDFELFKPIGNIKDSSFVVVGYDGNDNIREIIFNDAREPFSLAVYSFEEYRILLLKRKNNHADYLYTPTAIFNSKSGDENYMINVRAQFKNNYEAYDLFEQFPIGKFEDISCIMYLDKQLYPYEMIKFSNQRIVLYSEFKYEFEASRKLEFELMYFFIDPEHYYKDLNINENFCMKDIVSKMTELKTESNLVVFSKPSVLSKTQAPLWVFSGAHRYH
jgi:hypothetical protein